ncbi:TPA: hypothetical protein ACF54C_002136, partial [Serratia marcescens]
EREEFEKWAEQACGLPWGFLAKRRGQSGEYADQSYENMWGAWLASRELLANREAQPVAWHFPGSATESAQLGYDHELDDEQKRNCVALYTAPPAPEVNASPDFEAWFVEKYKQPERLMKNEDGAYKFSGVQMAFSAWVDGRAAMLAQPVSSGYTFNSPVIPDGWRLVPIDATRAMIDAAQRVEEDGYDAMHKAMLAAAPEGGNG